MQSVKIDVNDLYFIWTILTSPRTEESRRDLLPVLILTTFRTSYEMPVDLKIIFCILISCIYCASGSDIGLGPKIEMRQGVIMQEATLYPIYYGNWDTVRITKIHWFLYALVQSEWFKTDKINYNIKNVKVGKHVVIKSQATQLHQLDIRGVTGNTTNNQLIDIIQQRIQKDQFADENGIYVLFLSKNIKVPSKGTNDIFATSCAIHSHFFIQNQYPLKSIKYMAVPDAYYCSGNYANGLGSLRDWDRGLEAIFHSTYHELIETMTNPDDRGYRSIKSKPGCSFMEVADLCENNFGLVCFEEGTGAMYNLIMRGKKYLLQTNYNPVTRTCGNFGGLKQSYAASTAGIRCKNQTSPYCRLPKSKPWTETDFVLNE